MRLRSAVSLLALCVSPSLGFAQGRTIDEGTFTVTKTGSPTFTESFRFIRRDDGQITATSLQVTGTRQTRSTLTTDSSGHAAEVRNAGHRQGCRGLHRDCPGAPGSAGVVVGHAGGRRVGARVPDDGRSQCDPRTRPAAPALLRHGRQAPAELSGDRAPRGTRGVGHTDAPWASSQSTSAANR